MRTATRKAAQEMQLNYGYKCYCSLQQINCLSIHGHHNISFAAGRHQATLGSQPMPAAQGTIQPLALPHQILNPHAA